MPQERIPDADQNEQRALFGPMDSHLRAVRERYGVRITSRRGVLLLEGKEVEVVRDVARRARRVLQQLREEERTLSSAAIESILFDGGGEGAEGARARVPDASGAAGRRPDKRPRERQNLPTPPWPLTANQERYVASIRKRDIVFSIGPAGTGKTYLAVFEAVMALRTEQVRKLVLTRPAVEAGEKLGFLPGDFQAKINPYLRPLYDALGELLPYGEVQRYVDADVIEIAPLAYMRGRTLKDSFIILDEAQNTTPLQMKMFLTRMGFGSKVVVTGDVTQVDLPEDTPSGLVQSIDLLESVRGIDVIRFGRDDIQRHPLVQRIVDAYERFEPTRPTPRSPEGVAAPSGTGDEPREGAEVPTDTSAGESAGTRESSAGEEEGAR